MTEPSPKRTAGLPGGETIKVAIIEDVRTLRDGLSALIDGTSGFECTGRFRSAEEAIERGDVSVKELSQFERLAPTRQGNLELYSDVRGGGCVWGRVCV